MFYQYAFDSSKPSRFYRDLCRDHGIQTSGDCDLDFTNGDVHYIHVGTKKTGDYHDETWYGYTHSQLVDLSHAETWLEHVKWLSSEDSQWCESLKWTDSMEGTAYEKAKQDYFRLSRPVEERIESFVGKYRMRVVTQSSGQSAQEVWIKGWLNRYDPAAKWETKCERRKPAHTNFSPRKNQKKTNKRTADVKSASIMFRLGMAVGVSASATKYVRPKAKQVKHITWCFDPYIEEQSSIILTAAVKRALQRDAHKKAREEREEQQKRAVREKQKKHYKSYPKSVREASVQDGRKVKEQFKVDPDIEMQGLGRVFAGAAAAVGVLFGAKKGIDKLHDDVKKKLRDIFQAAAKVAKAAFGRLLWVVPMSMFLAWLVRAMVPVNPVIAKMVFVYVGLVLFSRPFTDWLKSVEDLVLGKEFEEQSSDCPFGKILAGAMAFSIFGQGKSHRQVGEFMKRTTMLGRSADNLDSFFGWVMDNMKSMLNYTTLFFSAGRVKIFKQTRKPLQLWLEKSAQAVSKYKVYAEDGKPEEADELIALIEEGSHYRILYQGTEAHRHIINIIAELGACLRPYAGSIAARNNRRFEPRMAVLCGDPGIGKTILANYLVPSVLILSGLCEGATEPAHVAKHIWQKGTSQYWNGYANQHALVMDDVFQAKASLMDEENDYLHIIKAVGTWAFPLNMADLDSKGRIYFNSKFIYATTNVDCIKSEAFKVIHSPEAVVRRFTHAYKLILKDEYKLYGTDRLDVHKFEDAKLRLEKEGKTGFDAFPWHFWEAAKHDYISGRTEDETIPLRTLVIKMARDLKDRLAAYESQNADLGSFISNMQSLEELETGVKPKPIEKKVPAEALEPIPEWAEIELQMDDRYTLPDTERARQEKFARNLGDSTWLVIRHYTKFLRRVEVVQAVLGAVYTAGFVLILKGIFASIKRLLFPSEKVGKEFRGIPLTRWNETTVEHINGILASYRVTWDDVKGVYYDSNHRVRSIVIVKDGKTYEEKPSGLYWFDNDVLSKNGYDLQSVHRERASRYIQLQGEDVRILGALPLSTLTVAPTDVIARDERSVVLDAIYSLVLLSPDGEAQHVGNMMMINGHMGVAPKHYRSNWRREAPAEGYVVQMVNTRNPAMAHAVPMSLFLSLPSVVDPEQDAEFIDFASTKIRAHRNVKGNFMREADIERYRGHAARLDIPVFGARKVYTVRTEAYNRVRLTGPVDVPTNMKRSWCYSQAMTSKGDCGSPLTILDMTAVSGRVCMGYHVCGNTRTRDGHAAIITQEMIERAEEKLKNVDDRFIVDLEEQGFPIKPSEDPFPDMGSFLTIGQIDKKYDLPVRTKLFVNEEVYGMLGENTQYPAKLSPFWKDGELIVPMLNAVTPYSGPVHHYHQPYINQAIHVAMKKFAVLSSADTRKILTTTEAVLGDPLMKLRSIPRNTSPGFPHALTVKDGKKTFFGTGADYDLDNDEFRRVEERVDHILDMASQNIRLGHVFIDFLKDELRSEEKVKEGKTRLISCAPMEYTIAVRKMFGAFSSSFFLHHTESGMCPGICAYTDWDKLYSVLQEKGRHVFDGDFKGFDSSEQADLLERLCDYINHWYNDGPVNARVRKVLFMELTHSRHLGGTGKDQSFIYQWNRSLPSGHPLTTVINSMYSLVAIVACYISITGDHVGFWENVSAVTYGDDNVVNVCDRLSDVFNQVSLSLAMDREFGMIYTSGKKDGTLVPYTTIDQVTFLQRGFRVEDQFVLSPLKLDSFLYTAYWSKNRLLQEQITADCMEKALEELSQHSAEEWDKFAPKIIDFLHRKIGVTRATPTREAYQSLVRTYSDHWY